MEGSFGALCRVVRQVGPRLCRVLAPQAHSLRLHCRLRRGQVGLQPTVRAAHERDVVAVPRDTVDERIAIEAVGDRPEARIGTIRREVRLVTPSGKARLVSSLELSQSVARGTEVAEWLQKRGVAAFVVKCRLKETPASAEELRKELGPFFVNLICFKDRDLTSDAAKQLAEDMRKSGAPAIADGRQAVRLVRQQAEKWRVEKRPHRVDWLFCKMLARIAGSWVFSRAR